MTTKKTEASTFNPLVILLVLAALAIGYLFSQVQTLKKGGAGADTAAVPGQAGAPDQVAPEIPPADLGAMPEITDADHVRGAADAQITLVEYSDYECGFCHRFHPTMQQVIEEYDGKVNWVYRHYPFLSDQSKTKAEAAECVAELGGNDLFWEFTDALMEESTTGVAVADLGPLAAELGVNQTSFQECLDSGKYTQKVADGMAGGSAAGINGTPGTIIVPKDGERQLIGGALPFDQVKAMLDPLL